MIELGITRTEAIERALEYYYSDHCSRGFYVELEITEAQIFKFEEGYLIHVPPKEGEITGGNGGLAIVEKAGGKITKPGKGGSKADIIKACRNKLTG